MTNFKYASEELPCFICHTRKATTELGWFTPCMKEDVIDQIKDILSHADTDYEEYFSVNIVCTEDEARDYLLLNYYGYSEHEINHGQVNPEDLTEVNDLISEHMTAEGVATFKHEVALQSCEHCTPEIDEDY
ncbi:hypothetical protein [Photobacterium leiognathi]|uniref:hypothetical protein n=1 Tax=Photobacterium leiognathi TaxID=553611 RepID=UPI0029828616|nr:hypothetical protein [Photobacterium leiognathi]